MVIKNIHIISLIFFASFLSFLIVSCSDKDDMILTERNLEDVLFDYHITDAMLQRSDIPSDTFDKYFDAILEKHSITRAQFDSSMIYYMKHADKIHDIYEHLSDRIANEARLQGIDGNNIFSGLSLKGDTANIWNLDNAKVFTTNENENLESFHFSVDSTYKKGDRFLLSFKTDFLYQDGARNGYAVMSLKFNNDSIVTRSTSLSSNGRNTIEINDDTGLGVKEIKGFIMQRKSNVLTERNNQTLRMMIVSEIQLIKMHKNESKNISVKNNDSITTLGSKDNEIVNKNENKSSPVIHSSVDTMHGPKLGMHKFYSR